MTNTDLKYHRQVLAEFLTQIETNMPVDNQLCRDAWQSWCELDAEITVVAEQMESHIETLKADNLKLATALAPVFGSHEGTA